MTFAEIPLDVVGFDVVQELKVSGMALESQVAECDVSFVRNFPTESILRLTDEMLALTLEDELDARNVPLVDEDEDRVFGSVEIDERVFESPREQTQKELSPRQIRWNETLARLYSTDTRQYRYC